MPAGKEKTRDCGVPFGIMRGNDGINNVFVSISISDYLKNFVSVVESSCLYNNSKVYLIEEIES